MATKLALIDSELLLKLLDRHADRASPPANPILREMNTIDSQMQGTLHDPKLSDLAKSQKINSLLTKHDNFTKQFQNQPPPLVAVENTQDPDQLQQDHWYTKIVNSVPQTLQLKAKSLLDHIKDSKNMQWDRDGRLVINGTTLSNTNMLDLIHGVTRQRKTQPTPTGAGEFLDALAKINTPNELVPNAAALRKSERKRRVREMSDVSEEHVTPSRSKKKKRGK